VREPVIAAQHKRKIRRAQHILLHFLKTRKYAKTKGFYIKSKFDYIWMVEWWLHIINPWLLLLGLVLLIINIIVLRSLFALLLVSIGICAFLFVKHFRVWLLYQLYLILAFIRCIKTKDIAWEK